MYVIVKRTILFVEVVPISADAPWITAPTGERVTLMANPAPQPAPDWLKNNPAYQDCLRYGVIQEVPSEKFLAPSEHAEKRGRLSPR